MRDPGGRDQGDRDRAGRGVFYMDRPRSPPSRPAQRSPSTSIASRHRYSRSDHDSSKHERLRSHDRSRERSERSERLNKYTDEPAGPHGPVEDLIPRFRAKKAREHHLDKESHRSRSRDEIIRPTRPIEKGPKDPTIPPGALANILRTPTRGDTAAESHHRIVITDTIIKDTDRHPHTAAPTHTDLLLRLEIRVHGASGSRSRGHHQDTNLIHEPSCPEAGHGNDPEMTGRHRRVLLQLPTVEEALRVAPRNPQGLRLPASQTWKRARTGQINHDLRGIIET
ncbi:hypothetical protein E4U42_000063 [Claviceps africana]|uniref:Uncharacterized protein n=1 Tax=Claviceps africana TaxID=83212 RepID=A0A8K0NEC5_9HYPO|nr:hypothetical protein E4U42_000063 [Claviceps africana]